MRGHARARGHQAGGARRRLRHPRGRRARRDAPRDTHRLRPPRPGRDVIKQTGRGVVSMVLCLEDSIDDADVEAAEA
ncbi:hypothetical protein ACWD6S_29520, partial [Streptomyces zhihengii]